MSTWKPIETAPRDGSYVHLRMRPGWPRDGIVAFGQWQAHPDMPAGGAWFAMGGGYITPGPVEWAPNTDEPCSYCSNGFRTGLPSNACENCMGTGLKYPAPR